VGVGENDGVGGSVARTGNEIEVADGRTAWICVSPETRVGRVKVDAGIGEAAKGTGFAEQAANPINNMKATLVAEKRKRARPECQNLIGLRELSGFLV
jgi:hypothetical protein